MSVEKVVESLWLRTYRIAIAQGVNPFRAAAIAGETILEKKFLDSEAEILAVEQLTRESEAR